MAEDPLIKVKAGVTAEGATAELALGSSAALLLARVMPRRAARSRATTTITNLILEKIQNNAPLDEADIEYAKATLGVAEAEFIRRRQIAERAKQLIAAPDVAGFLPALEKPVSEPTTSSEETTEDWISKFWDDAGLVTDQMLQELYARILAKEATSPGACSMRTLRVLRYMDRPTAESFGKILSATFDGRWIPGDSALLTSVGISYHMLLDLDDAGLISATQLSFPNPAKTAFYRYGHFILRIDDGAHLEGIENYSLTKSGRELARIADVSRSKDFLFAVARWLAREDPDWLAQTRREQISGPFGPPPAPRSPDFRVRWAEMPDRNWTGDAGMLEWNSIQQTRAEEVAPASAPTT